MTGSGIDGAFAASIIVHHQCVLDGGQGNRQGSRTAAPHVRHRSFLLRAFLRSGAHGAFQPHAVLPVRGAVRLGLRHPHHVLAAFDYCLVRRKNFSKIYGSVQLFFYLGPIVCNPLSGAIFDSSGSYSTAWMLYGVVILFCLIIGFIMLGHKADKKAKA